MTQYVLPQSKATPWTGLLMDPEGLVLFFPILQSTTLFYVETYLDMKEKAVLTWIE